MEVEGPVLIFSNPSQFLREEGQTIFWRWRVQVEVEGPVLLLLSPPFFLREERGPSTSSKTEVEGSSYTEYPLPPKFWWWRGLVKQGRRKGPSTSFGNRWRHRDRGWRGYCIFSARKEEPQKEADVKFQI